MSSRGRGWAYAGAFVGGVVSVAANVAHSFRPPTGAGAGWSPQAGAVALAAFWPLALLLAIEVLVRVDWPRQTRWTLLRFGGVTPVAVVAAIVSYRHLSGLLDWYGEDRVTVGIGPLAVDGLMVISTGALLALAARPGRSIDSIDQLDPTHSIEQPDSIEWVEVDPIESIEQAAAGRSVAAVESGGGSIEFPGSGRVVALVPRAEEPIESSVIEPRSEDIARLKAAVIAGEIPWPIKYEPARKYLRINMKFLKAAVQQINDDGWTPQIEGQEVIPGT